MYAESISTFIFTRHIHSLEGGAGEESRRVKLNKNSIRDTERKSSSVSSIVTLLLSGVFAYLAITGQTSQEFMTVYTVVIAFYFGTQTQKISDAVDKTTKEG